jgi:hypothetical protein
MFFRFSARQNPMGFGDMPKDIRDVSERAINK